MRPKRKRENNKNSPVESYISTAIYVMSKIRINELARDLEVKTAFILELLPELGIHEKKTHSSSLDEDHALIVRKHFASGAVSSKPREEAAPRPTTAPASAAIDAPPAAVPVVETPAPKAEPEKKKSSPRNLQKPHPRSASCDSVASAFAEWLAVGAAGSAARYRDTCASHASTCGYATQTWTDYFRSAPTAPGIDSDGSANSDSSTNSVGSAARASDSRCSRAACASRESRASAACCSWRAAPRCASACRFGSQHARDSEPARSSQAARRDATASSYDRSGTRRSRAFSALRSTWAGKPLRPPARPNLAGQPVARPIVPPRPDLVAKLTRPPVPGPAAPGLPRPGAPARPASPIPRSTDLSWNRSPRPANHARTRCARRSRFVSATPWWTRHAWTRWSRHARPSDASDV